MTGSLEKLISHLVLLFLALWVVAAALGKKSQVTIGSGSAPQNVPGGSNPYGGAYSFYGASQANHQQSVSRAPWAI